MPIARENVDRDHPEDDESDIQKYSRCCYAGLLSVQQNTVTPMACLVRPDARGEYSILIRPLFQIKINESQNGIFNLSMNISQGSAVLTSI